MARNMSPSEFPRLIQEKLAARDAKIPLEWLLPENITRKANRDATASAFSLLDESDLLTKRERHITEEYDATALLAELTRGSLSSLEVTRAFCKRAAIAQQLVNALTEIFFEKAFARAKECDAYLAQHGKPMGPFHGLPVSLKDIFMVEGEFATLGFVSYLEKPPADHNSVIVDMLLEAGAVLYCKTNVPQTLMVVESENKVFGCTLNPQRLCLTAGGSSSGEGALLGFRGSPLGVGTDIGGSIRCPSMLNGCYGFKPTANRLPMSGQQSLSRKGSPGIISSIGPHALSARDLTLFCKSVIQSSPWKQDPKALYMPWKEVQKKKLKIGLWMGVPEMPLTSSVARILRTACDALAGLGHTIVPVTTPEGAGFTALLTTATLSFSLDPNRTILKHVLDGNEELTPGVAAMQALMTPPEPISLDDVWAVNVSRESFRSAWHKILVDVDVLICPGSDKPGARHGTFGAPFYTVIWNLLDCPASVLPFSKVDGRIDTSSEVSGDIDVMDGIAGSLQVVGWTGMDEEVLMATEVISEALSAH
ncbi:putative amidase [Paramyrothecium foliicola]|nr:putative amidase [Paramyrothecium foliicola]